MINIQELNKLPKIELHCHLDGSVSLATLKKIYIQQGKPLPFSDQEIIQRITAPTDSQNLTEYLSCFHLMTAGLNNAIAIELALIDLAKQAIAENVVYIEVRFSPKHLATADFPMEEVVVAALVARNKIQETYSLRLELILCCMRGQSDTTNQDVLQLAKKYLGQGIVAIDLAGNESKYPTRDYQALFAKAVSHGVPFTIHAGETGCLDNVLKAVEFGASRIGHGIALMQSKEALELASKKGVLLEMCPVSNIQTGAVVKWADYPVKPFVESGVPLLFNTDNRTVSDTTLLREFSEVDHCNYSLTSKFILEMMVRAVPSIFATTTIKEQLVNKLAECSLGNQD